MSNENKFYVYALLDPRKPGQYKYGEYYFEYEPFYIGKGCGIRVHGSGKNNKSHKNNLKENIIKDILSNGFQIIHKIISEKMEEKESLHIEEKLIKLIGKIVDNNGILTNIRDSGDLSNNSNMTKYKMSINNACYWKGRKTPNGWNLWVKTNPKYCTYKLTSPLGEIFIVNDGLGKFCEKNGLIRSKMISVSTGDRRHHKGWVCSKISDEKYYNGIKFELINLKDNSKYITDNIKEFAEKYKLNPKRLYEVSRGTHYCHKGWICKIIINNDKPLEPS